MAESSFSYVTVEDYSINDEKFTILSDELKEMRPDQVILLFRAIEAIKRHRKGLFVPFTILSLFRFPEEYYKLKHPLIEVLLLVKCAPNLPKEMYFYRMINEATKEDSDTDDEIPHKRRRTSAYGDESGINHLT